MSSDWRAYNFSVEGCPHCCGAHPQPHRHGRMVLVPSEHPEARAYGVSEARPNFMHSVGTHPRMGYVCSCEGGQQRQRKVQAGGSMRECSHVQTARLMDEQCVEVLVTLPVGAGHTAAVVGSNGEDL